MLMTARKNKEISNNRFLQINQTYIKFLVLLQINYYYSNRQTNQNSFTIISQLIKTIKTAITIPIFLFSVSIYIYIIDDMDIASRNKYRSAPLYRFLVVLVKNLLKRRRRCCCCCCFYGCCCCCCCLWCSISVRRCHRPAVAL